MTIVIPSDLTYLSICEKENYSDILVAIWSITHCALAWDK